MYNRSNGKYDIMDILLNRKNFINPDMENSITNNIDEMLRIKLLNRQGNLENLDNLELTKRAHQIPDAHVNDLYREIKENLSNNSTNPEVAQMEIRNFLNTFLNDENTSVQLFEFLNKEKGVSQFADLKKLSEDELRHALSQFNLNQENMERVVKSIVSSLA